MVEDVRGLGPNPEHPGGVITKDGDGDRKALLPNPTKQGEECKPSHGEHYLGRIVVPPILRVRVSCAHDQLRLVPGHEEAGGACRL